jgi:hypothetical protein
LSHLHYLTIEPHPSCMETSKLLQSEGIQIVNNHFSHPGKMMEASGELSRQSTY